MIAYWVGPTPGRRPVSGDFSTASNWSTGTVPDFDTDIYLRGGDYTVTLSATLGLGSLSIGRGSTFSLRNESSDTLSIQLVRDSVNDGAIELVGSAIIVDRVFLNFGTITGRDTHTQSILAGGTLVNAGVVSVDAPGSIFALLLSVTNDVGGVVASRPSGTILFGGAVTNRGLLSADGGMVLFEGFGQAGTLTNLVAGKLIDGRYSVSGGGSMTLTGAAITDLSGTTDVVLDGPSSRLVTQQSGVQRTLESSLRRIGEDASLHVVGGRDFAMTERLDVLGVLDLGGGTLTSRRLSVERDGTLTGFGTVAAAETEVRGTVTATGTLRFDARATLGGVLDGAGELVLAGQDTVILRESDISVDALTILADTRIDADLAYAGHLTVRDATLDLQGRRFRSSGRIDLDDAVLTGDPQARLVGQTVASGESVIDMRVTNRGTVTVADGVLTFERELGGRGTLAIGDGATLAFSPRAVVGENQVISFSDGDGTLAIGNTAGFKAGLVGFGEGDAVELRGVSADANLRYAADADGVGGTLRIFSGGETIRLRLATGEYGPRDFVLADGGDGDAVLTIGAAAPAFAPAPAFAHVDPAGLFGGGDAPDFMAMPIARAWLDMHVPA